MVVALWIEIDDELVHQCPGIVRVPRHHLEELVVVDDLLGALLQQCRVRSGSGEDGLDRICMATDVIAIIPAHLVERRDEFAPVHALPPS